MTGALHLVVGPDEHGVVLHALGVAAACGHPVLRIAQAAEVTVSALRGYGVVHVAFTDRLFGRTGEEAAEAFALVAGRIRDAGASVSVTLHDVPRGETPLQQRRRVAYLSVLSRARGAVLCSRTELAAVQDDVADVHCVRCIPLPIDRLEVPQAGRPAPSDRDVVVLGFVYPDRGYEAALAQLPQGCGLLAVGRAAAGHETLPNELRAVAERSGRTFRLTGFVDDGALGDHLQRAAVPLAPNVRVGASGSIGTWLAHGRRPLVPRTAYTEELLERMPGSLVLYDAQRPGALHAAMCAALADPDSTWLPPDVRIGPTSREVGAAYRGHLDACEPPGPDAVPGNRWDLLPPVSGPYPAVSVVVPYYADQAGLDRVLTGLRLQDYAGRLEVVVADDGSPAAPDVGAAGELPTRVVRQERQGFGAARARNLGARSAGADVLLFLDADTVPEPHYVDRLVATAARHPDLLVVGRRRHGLLDGWSAGDIEAWLTGRGPSPQELTEPAWLRDTYCDTHNLLDARPGAYRFVISAVLATSRALFDRVGGFDERFTRYGGEDWEFANRAWHAGALFAHVPDAVAWHDGPHWGERAGVDHRSAKNVETVALSRLLPDPRLRGGGQWFPYPFVAVRLLLDDIDGIDGVLATARSAFAAGADCQFWLVGPAATSTCAALGDPRIHVGPVPPDVLARAAVVVDVERACDLSTLAALAEHTQRHGLVRTPALTARTLRAVNRCGSDAAIGRAFGTHDRCTPVPFGPVRLDALLPGSGPRGS